MVDESDLLAWLQHLANHLPGVETLVPMGPMDEKERLIEMAPEIYFETEHYKGWPALLCAPLRSRMRNCSTG